MKQKCTKEHQQHNGLSRRKNLWVRRQNYKWSVQRRKRVKSTWIMVHHQTKLYSYYENLRMWRLRKRGQKAYLKKKCLKTSKSGDCIIQVHKAHNSWDQELKHTLLTEPARYPPLYSLNLIKLKIIFLKSKVPKF